MGFDGYDDGDDGDVCGWDWFGVDVSVSDCCYDF